MGKIYKGDRIRVQPPNEGWGQLWFSNGYQAQVSGVTETMKGEQKMLKFYLKPYEATAKRYNIDMEKDLNEINHTYEIYPKSWVYPLNTFDPARRVFFSLRDWDGKSTEATEWLKGEKQAEEIRKLRAELRSVRAYNEKLREKNLMLMTNMKNVMKDNADSLKFYAPALKSILGIGGEMAKRDYEK